MRLYRLGKGVNAEGWPFLLARHAYLADGTPLTEYDRHGRIVPSRKTFGAIEKICSDGRLSLADRRSGVEALARALDEGDRVRAPLLLLHLQIDPVPALAKFNPWHKPPGPGGGQFTFGSEAGASTGQSGFQTVAQNLHVGLTSTYQPGIYGEDVDIAHKLVMTLVQSAILAIGKLGFRPGVSGYGQELHDILALEVMALNDPELRSGDIYLSERSVLGKEIPAGASVPDIVYGPPEQPLVIWELKTGRAVDISDKAITEQRERTLKNVPGNPLYEYILVYEK